MKLRLTIVLLVIAVTAIIFFFPKSSYQWGSGTGTTLDCECFGFNKVSNNFIGGGSEVCFGWLRNCKSDAELQKENERHYNIIDQNLDVLKNKEKEDEEKGIKLDICHDYRYGNCPVGCLERCVSSHCSNGMCTDDCGGEGSCVAPADIGWIKYQNEQFGYEFYYPQEWKDDLTTRVIDESIFYYLPAYRNPENKKLGLMDWRLVCIGRKTIIDWDKEVIKVQNNEQPTMGDEIARKDNYVYYRCPQFEAFAFTVSPDPYKVHFNVKSTFKFINSDK